MRGTAWCACPIDWTPCGASWPSWTARWAHPAPVRAVAKTRVRLVSWAVADSKTAADALRDLGYAVDRRIPSLPELVQQLSRNPPAAIVIDLGRLPSQGRDLAVLLRQRRSTRRLPLVFLGGQREKVADVRRLIPDAVYTHRSRLAGSLIRAIERPPRSPVVHRSVFAAYAGVPLVRKLGIRPGAVVSLLCAPRGFAGQLGSLSAGARVRRAVRPGAGLAIGFVRDRRQLARLVEVFAASPAAGPLWIAWPKQGSGLAPDLSQAIVRKHGLAAGLVDYKICSIDPTWSALLFRRRERSGA